MPYPRAHYYVLAVIAVIVVGFWPSYFAAGHVPWQFHAHGIAASLWVIMVAAQSWTVHHRQLALHRAVGKSSLLLFPFLIGGLTAIIDVTAKKYLAGAAFPVTQMFGASFLIGMAIAIAAYVTVYYRALKYRRTMWVHAGYMLATPLILFELPFSRILNGFMPGLAIRGPADFGLIMPAILWSIALELLIIALIWVKYRERATPFLVAGGFILAQMLGMGLMADSAWLRALLVAIGELPSAAVVLSGFAIGALTSWAGWTAGKRPARPVAEAQPA